MKDIQQNSPCSTGTYPLKKHNHMTSVSKRCQQWSCTNTYMDNDTVLLKFSSKLKKLRQMVFHSTWTHELRFGTTRALQYCYTLHTLHTLPYDELNYWCSSSFLKTIGLIQKLSLSSNATAYVPRKTLTRSAKIINLTCKIVYFQVVA